MRTGFLLSLLSFFLVSCASRTLDLEYPATWKLEERTETPRWVVAHPASYATALAPLKKARGAQGYHVISIIGATPDLIHRRVSQLDLGKRERDALLLVGTTTSIPGAEGRHQRMKGLPSDSRYAMKPDDSTPLFAVGRLPAASPAQTRTLVSKILAFERSRLKKPSDQKQAILLVGDPIGGPNRMWAADKLVSSLSRSLMRKAHRSWTFSGAADVPGHPFAAPEGEFPSRFVSELNKPYCVGAYFGHSSSSNLCQLADGANLIEGLQHRFTGDRWDQLPPSSQRGLFLSCGCYCLDGDDAVGYRGVQAPGGPVAFIGATKESYSAPGYLAAKGAVSVMKENPPATVGECFLAVQKAIAAAPLSRTLFFLFDRVDGSGGERSLRDQRLEHLEMWMLVGDPATKLF